MRPFSVQTLPAFVPTSSTPYECALVYPAVFSARQCERVIEQGLSLDTDIGRVGDGQGSSEQADETRQSRVGWIPAEEPLGWIHRKLAAIAGRANRVYGFDLLGFTEDLQFTQYEGSGASYSWHQDGLDGDLAVRKLSLVVQLSDPDDYEGGDLEFFGRAGDDGDVTAPDAEVLARVRSQGTVVAFPAFEYHRVTPLLSGTRRSIVCWIGGPPFR